MAQGEGWEVPAGTKTWSTFHFFKVDPRHTMRLVILSDQPFWYVGHYVRIPGDGPGEKANARMVPCLQPHCEMCEDGIGQQLRYVFAAVDIDSKRIGIIEFSESNAELLRDWMSRNEGLRGMHIELSKHSLSAKSRTTIKFLEMGNEAWWRSLEMPDPKVALELTWRKLNVKIPKTVTRRFGV
jgi:hypothetical protein